MLELSLCRLTETREMPVASGVVIDAEGLALCGMLEAGEEKLTPYVSGSYFVGFSYGETFTPATKSKVERVVVPSASPYVVSLAKNNLLADNYLLYNVTVGGYITKDTGYTMDVANGSITFDASYAGMTIDVTYRYYPTTNEILMEDKVSLLTRTAAEFLGQIGVITEGEVFTDQFDAAIDWSAATGIKAGANGILTNQDGTGALILGAKVSYLPTADYPFLGIRF